MSWVTFMDASALVKRYSEETGSREVDEIFLRLPVTHVACSILGVAEVVSILVRKRNDGRIEQRFFEQAILRFEREFIEERRRPLIPIPPSLVLEALDLIYRHNLNASDALILRSVLGVGEQWLGTKDQLLFVTSDRRLARAAVAENLQVFDPERQDIQELQALLEPSAARPPQ